MKDNYFVKLAKRRRQMVLNYINAIPGCTMQEMSESLKISKNSITKICQTLEDFAEVRREPVMIDYGKNGKKNIQRTNRHYALAVTTRDVEPDAPKQIPGRTRNLRYDDANARPLPNQGGQGTIGVRPRGHCTILGE